MARASAARRKPAGSPPGALDRTMTTKAVYESEFSKSAVTKGQVLMVATSCDSFADGATPTGLWLSELADPYYIFKSQGYDVTIASPKGGAVPIVPASTEDGALTAEARRFNDDAEASQQLKASVALAEIHDPASYDCVFLPGGHGPMFDLSGDAKLAQIVTDAFGAGKCVAAVCHGPAGLLSARAPGGGGGGEGGGLLVAGKRVTGFTADEERAAGKEGKVPFLLDERLAAAGARVYTGPAMQPHVEVDGLLVTGQNPASAAAVAEAAVRVMGGGGAAQA
ncbi:MAG: ThiJ/PfpI domain-containing protein [Monoraphidium minutum]|nr:MAG: ThiJ/PfpI domain-containing protein [Monoraphidium minutum]